MANAINDRVLTAGQFDLWQALVGAAGEVVGWPGLAEALRWPDPMDESFRRNVRLVACRINQRMGWRVVEAAHGRGYRLTAEAVEVLALKRCPTCGRVA